MTDDNIFGEVIYSYTRAQAIEDGELVDVTEMAKERGFKFPVAVTRAVWCKYVEVPKGVTGQNEQGRLWDILHMLHFGIKTSKPIQHGDGSQEIRFKLQVVNEPNPDNWESKKHEVTLKCICGPGDNMEPVMTVLMLDED